MRRCAEAAGPAGDRGPARGPRPTIAEQNRLERLRDPAHERLLTADELARLVDTDDVEVRDVVRPLEPWLDQTATPEPVRDEIRAALARPGSGFRPTQKDGELHFVHTMASLIG